MFRESLLLYGENILSKVVLQPDAMLVLAYQLQVIKNE
jgi:hypothetical protein